MTDAFDSIISGDILKGLVQVFTSTTGDVLFFFVAISLLSLVVFVSTQSMAYAAIIFVIFAGALVTSHLSQFNVTFGLIPEQFQGVILIIIVLAFMYAVYVAWTSRRN